MTGLRLYRTLNSCILQVHNICRECLSQEKFNGVTMDDAHCACKTCDQVCVFACMCVCVCEIPIVIDLSRTLQPNISSILSCTRDWLSINSERILSIVLEGS